MTNQEQAAAKEIARRIEALATPGKTTCAIPDEVKIRVANYLRTWVLPLAEALAKPAKDRDGSQRQLLKRS